MNPQTRGEGTLLWSEKGPVGGTSSQYVNQGLGRPERESCNLEKNYERTIET